MAYLTLRGRPIGGLMLGRTGRNFSRSDVVLLEGLLPALSVARASYGLALEEALPQPTSGLSRVVNWIRGQSKLAEAVTEDGTTVAVRDRGGHREMVSQGMTWTRADVREPHRSGWFYVDLFHLAAARAARRRRALFVGCGGGVAARQFSRTYPGISIDVVESEKVVIELAKTWFLAGSIAGVSIHAGDGASFVAKAPPASWDVIVVDAYEGSSLPRAFATRTFFAAARKALCRGGAMAINVVGPLAGRGDPETVARAAAREFSDVRCVPVFDPGESYSAFATRNVVVLAQ